MKVRVLFISITCAILMSGCEAPDIDLYGKIEDIFGDFGKEETVTGKDGENVTQEIIIINDYDKDDKNNAASDTQTTTPRENSIKPVGIRDIENVANTYAYDSLDEHEKIIYDEIYNIITGFQTGGYLSSLDTDEIDHAFTCMLIDHPEIFYVKGYSIKTYTRGGKIEKILMSGSYTMNENEILSCKSVIDRYVDECESTIPLDADDYTKVKKVYEFIIRNTDYDKDAPNNQNLISVFRDNKSVCQGYAKGMQYILNDLGVFCTLVEGSVKEGESHVWNLVKVDGEFYYVDPTWGDASYNLVTEESGDSAFIPPEVNYDYLCTTTEEIKKSHLINATIPMPECTHMEANYYVREGLFFEGVNEEALDKAFIRAYNAYEETLTLKCSNEQVYSDMKYYLLEKQKVFNYLRDTSVSYVEIPEQNEIMFYL
ncbi:MAG: hypothetical protein K6B28_04405 [Lachnospiraceae bacterium]|nr:hypothetical protein [Lachnospiraceae bacterium]